MQKRQEHMAKKGGCRTKAESVLHIADIIYR